MKKFVNDCACVDSQSLKRVAARRSFAAVVMVFAFVAAAHYAHAADSLNTTLTMPPNNLGLVGHWTFDGPTINGTTVTDVSGQGDNGTMVNNPSPVAGVLGQALSFPPTTGNYIAVSSPSSALNISYPLTMSLWYKTTNTNGAATNWNVMVRRDTASGTRYLWSLDFGGSSVCGGQNLSGKVAIEVYNSSNDYCVPGASVTSDGKWHNVVGIISSTQLLSLYVDGVLQGTIQGASLGVPNGQFWIGQDPSSGGGGTSGAQFIGSIDDVRIYNRPLSAYEIKQLYNTGTATHQNTTVNPPDLQQGLVGHWTFDGPTISGTTVTDVSGSGNNGTMVNGPTVVPGVEGQALSFNGTSQYVSAGVTNVPTGAPLSVSAWLKPTNLNGTEEKPIGRWFATGSTYFFLFDIATTNKITFYAQGNGTNAIYSASYATALSNNVWYHVVGTIDASNNIHLYVNGVSTTGGSAGFTNGGSSAPSVFIGAGQNTATVPEQLFSGSIDDVRIYNRALSASQITQLYDLGTATHQNATVNPPNLQSGLVGHWTFDGPTISGTTVKDVSDSGNPGTTVNGPTPVAGVLGQALSFNGTSQYVNVGNSPTLNVTGNTLTISAWVRKSSSSGNSIAVFSRGTPSVSGYEFSIGDIPCAANQIKMTKFGVADVCIGSFPTDTKWHLLTGVWGPSGETAYVDGAVNGTYSNTANFLSSSENAYVGVAEVTAGGTLGAYFNGSIDDVRIYNRALSASEVKQLYNLGR